MQIDEVCSCSFDMCLVGESDIFFFKINSIFFSYTTADLMFCESAKYFGSFSLESKLEYLSFEHFLYIKCLFESHTSLLFRFFFILFYLFHSLSIYFACKSLWDERVTSLSSRNFDYSSFSSKICHISEEFDSEFCSCHIYDFRQRHTTEIFYFCKIFSYIDTIYNTCNVY